MKPVDFSSARSRAGEPRPEAIEAAAADWLVRRHAGFSADEAVRFDVWIRTDPRHAAAFDRLRRAWEELDSPRRTGQAGTVRSGLRLRAERRTRRRQTWIMGAAGLAAAAALVMTFLPLGTPPAGPLADPPTAVLRPNLQTLADGSTVQLNAGAEIAVEFTAEKRGVRLLRGEALFAVMKDAARPFVVNAAGVEVRAVGTAFSVRYAPQQVDVLVTEGRVSVKRMDEPPPASALPILDQGGSHAPAIVSAGERASVPLASATGPSSGQPLPPAEITAALAWRSRRIELSGTPLAEVVGLFNRQNRVQLLIADAPTRRLQVTGIVWTDDPEGFVRLIEASLELRSERRGDAIVLRQGAEQPAAK